MKGQKQGKRQKVNDRAKENVEAWAKIMAKATAEVSNACIDNLGPVRSNNIMTIGTHCVSTGYFHCSNKFLLLKIGMFTPTDGLTHQCGCLWLLTRNWTYIKGIRFVHLIFISEPKLDALQSFSTPQLLSLVFFIDQ